MQLLFHNFQPLKLLVAVNDYNLLLKKKFPVLFFFKIDFFFYKLKANYCVEVKLIIMFLLILDCPINSIFHKINLVSSGYFHLPNFIFLLLKVKTFAKELCRSNLADEKPTMIPTADQYIQKNVCNSIEQ